MIPPSDESIDQLASLLQDASHVAMLTGAGVSAESGLSTFRDKEEGLWAKYDPLELAHIDAFRRDPELVTKWYHWRFTRARSCKPNAGHFAIGRLQKWFRSRGGRLDLITQNVDGLHQRGGADNVIELHGTILTWRCLRTGERYSLDQIDFSTFPPRSESGGLLRPDVVWFGEMLPADALDAAQQAVAACDAFVSVGTSATVWPAAGFADMAQAGGAAIAELNRETTPLSDKADVSVLGLSASVLRDVCRLLGIEDKEPR
ncbi:MAG: NAD-dependent deacylase [Planctomycetota bacterium]